MRMLEGGRGGGGRDEKYLPKDKGGQGEKRWRKKSVGIHLLGELREGGFLISPNACPLQMPRYY